MIIVHRPAAVKVFGIGIVDGQFEFGTFEIDSALFNSKNFIVADSISAKIEIKDYLLTPSENAKGRFDLSKKVIRTKKDTKETYESDDVIGYGMTLESCVGEIIAHELDKDDSIVSLLQFVNAYRKERELIMDILK